MKKETKKQKAITALKEELEQNNQTYKANIDLLKKKAELLEACKKDLDYEEKRYKVYSLLIDIELKHPKVINPLMEFHNQLEWQNAFLKMKEFEKFDTEKTWELAQKQCVMQINKVNQMIDEKKIEEQQKRIQERNPEIITSLKNHGIKIEEQKLDYIG